MRSNGVEEKRQQLVELVTPSSDVDGAVPQTASAVMRRAVEEELAAKATAEQAATDLSAKTEAAAIAAEVADRAVAEVLAAAGEAPTAAGSREVDQNIAAEAFAGPDLNAKMVELRMAKYEAAEAMAAKAAAERAAAEADEEREAKTKARSAAAQAAASEAGGGSPTGEQIQAGADALAEAKRAANIIYLTKAGRLVWVAVILISIWGIAAALKRPNEVRFYWLFSENVGPTRRALVVSIVFSALLLATGSVVRRQDGGLRSYLIGRDGRFSTSQTQAALWTLSLAFVLSCLLLRAPLGEKNDAFAEDFQSLDESYLLLLGGPAAAWVLTRRLTASKVDDQTLQKVEAEEAQLRDLVSNDDGRGDLNDAQFFTFSMLALVYFVAAFAAEPTGIPVMPIGLAALTSAAALLYLGGKGLEANAPLITSVERADGAGPVRAGDRVRIRGSHFVPPGAGGDLDKLTRVRVAFGDAIAVVVPQFASSAQPASLKSAALVRREVRNPRSDRIEVAVPLDVTPGRVSVRVMTAAGLYSNEYTLPLQEAKPAIVGTDPQPLQMGMPARIRGRWFTDAGFPADASVRFDGLDAHVTNTADSFIDISQVPASLTGPTTKIVVTTTAGVALPETQIPVV